MKLTRAQEQQIKKLCQKYKVNTLYLFGSQATGKTSKLSDWDFAVQLKNTIKPSRFFGYQIKLNSELMRLLDADVGELDVVVLNQDETPLLLKYNVIKDGQILYCLNQDQRKDLEFETMRDYLDWEYYEDLFSKIFLKKLASGTI
ncbi:nucleotidyltransferase domain-containing protein [Patescibacteria group bacterium]|nr:nucleotidyltransferase domain-containing protein [Patescibacteria group bacterium]